MVSGENYTRLTQEWQGDEVNLKIAMLSYHTCPLATLGGKDTGGMNVYVRDLTRTLGALGVHVDVFTRSQDEHVPHVLHDLGYGNRVVHVKAGQEVPLPKHELLSFVPEFFTGIEEFTSIKDLEVIKGMKNLHTLNLDGIKGCDLKPLQKLSNLQSLSINISYVPKAGIHPSSLFSDS